MEGKYAVIFTGGSYDTHEKSEEYYVNLVKNSSYFICADSGANFAYKFHVKPKYILGDMDSISQSVLDYFSDIEKITYQPEKAFTDTEIAIEKCKEEGFTNIILCGGIGSRMDHSINNVLSMIRYRNEGVNLHIYNHRQLLFFATREQFIEDKVNWTMGLVPMTPVVKKCTIEGCYYPLEKRDIYWGDSLTISNIVTDKKARITFEDGELLVVLNDPSHLY